jgi:NADH:ubiquinone oxidoreductase subunit D
MFAQFGKAADHCAVLGEQTVAVQFLKIRERVADVIQRVRTARMPRELDALPGGEVQENLPPGFLQLFSMSWISSSKLMPSECFSGCWRSSSSLVCSSMIGFSKSS